MSFQHIKVLIENKRWDDLSKFCSESPKSIFEVLYKDEMQKALLHDIPDETLNKLIQIDTSSTLTCMLKFYNPKYHDISIQLLKSNNFNDYSDQLVSLLDNSFIISIIQSIDHFLIPPKPMILVDDFLKNQKISEYNLMDLFRAY